jgi:hypothetical protein
LSPSQSIASRIALTDCLSRLTSVSSTRRMKVPPCFLRKPSKTARCVRRRCANSRSGWEQRA